MLEEVFLRRFNKGEKFSEDKCSINPIMTHRLHSLIIIIEGSVDILDKEESKIG